MKKYYEAYNERYKTIHEAGHSWSSNLPTPIVLDVINKYSIAKEDKILELGCGEGRDSKALLDNGYNLLATDISKEAIDYCQNKMPNYKHSFKLLDCLNGELESTFRFIYAIAVLHMLVEDEDRKKFYKFVYSHLHDNGIALITSMGNGSIEISSDISKAFEIQKREHPSGEVMVASTSCRMVTFDTFKKEIENENFEIVETGITESLPDFNELMFAVIKKRA